MWFVHRLLRHRIDWYQFGTAHLEGYCSCGRMFFRTYAAGR